MSKTLTDTEYENLRYSETQYINMKEIHIEYKEEKEKETNRLNDRIKNLENTLQSERQTHKEEFEKLKTNMELMAGVDLSGTNLSREQKYFYKSQYVLDRIKKTQTTVKNKGYKDIIISIHSQIRDFIKGKREHWISSKQEAVITKFINSNPPSQDERLWENGKPYKKRG